MNHPVRIGILGCGRITQERHAPEYAASPHARLCAWYDPCTERAEDMARQYGGTVYGDWRALVASGQVDAVSVCSPNALHAEMTLAALDAGLHVLLEKPMATALTDCERMAAAARGKGLVLFVDHSQRNTPVHREAKRWIQAGKLGRVLGFQTAFGHSGPETWTVGDARRPWFFQKDQAGSGALFDIGVHKLDLMVYLLGEPVASVGCFAGALDKKDPAGNPISVEDNAVCLLRMRSGALGTLMASWTHYGVERNSTAIFGEKGVLRLYEEPESPFAFYPREGTPVRLALEAIQSNDNQFATGMMDLFLSDILAGREASVPLEEVLWTMRAAFALKAAQEAGGIVQL